jgi:hypothetical protein
MESTRVMDRIEELSIEARDISVESVVYPHLPIYTLDIY